MVEYCPHCRARRVEALRYCASCRFDFSTINHTPPSASSVAPKSLGAAFREGWRRGTKKGDTKETTHPVPATRPSDSPAHTSSDPTPVSVAGSPEPKAKPRATVAGCLILVVMAVAGYWALTTLLSGSGSTPSSPGSIPGLTAADIKLNLQDRDFTCDGPRSDATGGGISYSCTSPGYRVYIHGSGVTNIDSVTAFALGDDATAASFLGYLASVPYRGADQARARVWVESNVSTGGSLVIGGVTFRLGGPDGGRTLDITGS